ncbi:MAG: hypothetical protein HY683_08210 [Chloroflexi bacterium]|nr:hypothetical protein [Chloroflexota bacterium]
MVIATKGLVVLEPVTEPTPSSAEMAPRPRDLNGKRVALLTNGKRNSDVLVKMVYDLLAERYQLSGYLHRDKVNMSRPAPQSIVEELATYDIAITAIGD